MFIRIDMVQLKESSDEWQIEEALEQVRSLRRLVSSDIVDIRCGAATGSVSTRGTHVIVVLARTTQALNDYRQYIENGAAPAFSQIAEPDMVSCDFVDEQSVIVTLPAVIESLEHLAAHDEEELRKVLSERFWRRRLVSLLKANPEQRPAAAWRYLMERQHSGELDDDIRIASLRAWQDFVGEYGSLSALVVDRDLRLLEPRAGDPEVGVDATYHDVQSAVIQLRKVVASAIAQANQLTHEVQRTQDQAATWRNRVNMAQQQNNLDLAQQAQARCNFYSRSASDLEVVLKSHNEKLAALRSALADIEMSTQMAYTRKQELFARAKAARTTLAANNMISKVTFEPINAALAGIEKEVERLESEAAAPTNSTQREAIDVVDKAIEALGRATALLERMEQQVVQSEGKVSPTDIELPKGNSEPKGD